MGLPLAVTALAARQHAVVAAEQFDDLGVAPSTLSSWVRAGWLERPQPRSYAIAGAPTTYEGRLMAALLSAGPGSAASHRAAALLWKMSEEAPVEITVPRGRTPDLSGVVVHQSRDPMAVVHRRRLPVTTPMRALVDLGAVVGPAAVEDALNRGLVERLFTVAAVEWALAEVARPGRRGVGALRTVLDRRALDERPPDGLLEPRFAQLRLRHGLPEPVFQLCVRWGPKRFVIDFAYPDLMIAIEVDGYEKRATREAFQSDTERQTALAAMGWKVLRFTWADVVRRPGYVARVILEVIGRAECEIAH